MKGSVLRKPLPVFVLSLAAVVPIVSHAQEFKPMIKAGFDFGGDTLVNVTFTNGETDSIKANDGFYFGVGVSILATSEIEAELSLSYKFESITAENGDVDFTRMPLDALVFYRFPSPSIRVGGGLTYHLNPKLSGSGIAGGLNATFDDALGFVLQADYVFPKLFLVGVRYTQLEYEASNGAKAKSNGAGLTFSMRF
jgi:hypothetical protein